ncbi:transcription antitermination factor NusB [Sedimentibacter sp. MB31-C6]|uniref:transcription antitermination factor NusB n=1 Tax=Sedimentibacter sp. MB31-C6 TaxID=3109366 RepID=UPI002DDDAA56|nr:transcription antitermination factor NusB [Sedimentibacter sp. MB36-C1]WSI04188.1 transcription antitermination factor NusB [Sedimentibacter sp. MB36-C1]WSI05639.1 transcription antitermination factor NusB [Sedimentibacter sp. MB36-C1]
MKRKETREEAVKIAYSMDINKNYDKMGINQYVQHFELTNIDIEYLEKTIGDMIDNLEKIDQYIEENSKDWKITRIAKVDLAVLRISLSEILYNKSIPESVSINEAVEISKKYSKDDSHKFINGLLGSIVRKV